MSEYKRTAIVVAGGSGTRTGLPFNKAFLDIGGMPVIARAISVFDSHPSIDEVVVVARENEIEKVWEISKYFSFSKITHVVPGGKERQYSVYNGLKATTGDIVLIHDAARPFLPKNVLDKALTIPPGYCGVLVALPARDTIKIRENGVIRTLDRRKIFLAQTPQVFWRDFILSAYEKVFSSGLHATDDASVAELVGGKIYIVEGSVMNFKITTMEDVYTALSTAGFIKIGHGYDVHAFDENEESDSYVILGGVKIPSKRKLIAHSDGDVVLHALMDAILGASGLPDIGHLFPNTDPKYRNADSMNLLKNVLELAKCRIINVDITIIAQYPKIAPYIEKMREKIANALKISPGNIGIKATTNEGLGDIGVGKGIAVHAVTLISSMPREWKPQEVSK